MGNGYKVWHYTSTLMHETHLSDKEELWEVKWQSSPVEKFPAFQILNKPVAGGVKPSQPVASKQAYRLITKKNTMTLHFLHRHRYRYLFG